MNDISPSLRPAGGGADPQPTSANGTGNAFGQLLRSMEQTMWRGAESASPAGGQPAAPCTAAVATAPHVGRLAPALAASAPPFEPAAAPLPSFSGATATRTAAATGDATATAAAHHEAAAARPSPASDTPSPLLPQARPGGTPAAAAAAIDPPDEADATPPAPAPASTDTRPAPAAPAPAPLRVTLMAGENVASVAVRVASAGPGDLDTLDSLIRTTLLQGGYATSKLVINGVDRTVTASGDTPHGN
ncbi:hypothetical protein GIY62_17490 [Burkholderia plantarii]|uniref:hypothetical protein n=1 Tax=Burkholderia plantarii TaxID=41899 RepID=UPI00272C8232|nr:hypothetical protein [Burkholderia plantarii]WLE58875.1 hypothetical protein GIY62_17490 [Burkholderia plantarii]